jgi:hypothetical protein
MNIKIKLIVFKPKNHMGQFLAVFTRIACWEEMQTRPRNRSDVTLTQEHRLNNAWTLNYDQQTNMCLYRPPPPPAMTSEQKQKVEVSRSWFSFKSVTEEPLEVNM